MPIIVNVAGQVHIVKMNIGILECLILRLLVLHLSKMIK
jgi:hypothetical protein